LVNPCDEKILEPVGPTAVERETKRFRSVVDFAYGSRAWIGICAVVRSVAFMCSPRWRGDIVRAADDAAFEDGTFVVIAFNAESSISLSGRSRPVARDRSGGARASFADFGGQSH
jgi:hypothetical protein